MCLTNKVVFEPPLTEERDGYKVFNTQDGLRPLCVQNNSALEPGKWVKDNAEVALMSWDSNVAYLTGFHCCTDLDEAKKLAELMAPMAPVSLRRVIGRGVTAEGTWKVGWIPAFVASGHGFACREIFIGEEIAFNDRSTGNEETKGNRRTGTAAQGV